MSYQQCSAVFADRSWISQNGKYNASTGEYTAFNHSFPHCFLIFYSSSQDQALSGCLPLVFRSMISNIVFAFSGSSIASSNRNLSSKFNSFNDFLWFISSSPLLYRYNTCKEELFSFMHMITQNLYIYQYIPLSSFIRHVFICFL